MPLTVQANVKQTALMLFNTDSKHTTHFNNMLNNLISFLEAQWISLACKYG